MEIKNRELRRSEVSANIIIQIYRDKLESEGAHFTRDADGNFVPPAFTVERSDVLHFFNSRGLDHPDDDTTTVRDEGELIIVETKTSRTV